MKFLLAIASAILIMLTATTAQATTPRVPPFELEKKIAYQQGQFGALYAHCGSRDDKVLIGGSLDSWRTETFQGYNGSAAERAGVQKSFDEAVEAVSSDPGSCEGWIKQAAATWRSIVVLSQGDASAAPTN